jgi:predicted CopG family antitoxin
MEPDTTTIHVDRETQKRLFMLKRKGETYDHVIKRLLHGRETQT